MKCEEYFAHIHQAYFNNPAKFQKQYPQDFALIDKIVKYIDQNFNPFESFEKREKELLKIG